MSALVLKKCSKCVNELPITEFPIADRQGHRRSWCRRCEAQRVRDYYATNASGYRDKTKARAARWEKANPGRFKYHNQRAQLKYKTGLTAEQYEEMLQAQGRRCALCRSADHGRKNTSQGQKWKANRWNVDHCHDTGKIRGLLCHKCNAQLGGFECLIRDVGIERITAYLNGSDAPLQTIIHGLFEADNDGVSSRRGRKAKPVPTAKSKRSPDAEKQPGDARQAALPLSSPR